MDDERGEFMEKAELVSVVRSESKMEKPARGCRREAGSWFQRRGEAQQKGWRWTGKSDHRWGASAAV